MKKCSKCGRWLVASTVNFQKRKSGKYGLQGKCKECASKQNKQRYENNKEKILERQKQWYEDNKEKRIEYQKQYYENNKEKITEYNKQYHETNKDKIAEKNKRWYEANKEKRHEYHKQYRRTPQGQVAMFNGDQRRRIREEQQGSGITKDQWVELMSFFGWRCAYSGEYLGGNDNLFNRTIDHIVPLNSGGDNMVWNCVPMLRSLNSSKHTKDMEEWYKEQDCYNPKRLAKIYEWQEYARKKWYKEEE